VGGLRVRGGAQFSLKAFDMFRIEFWPFYGGTGLSLRDFYGAFEPSPTFRLQFGRFREPVSYERTQSLDYLPFFQRSLVRNLAPGRDIGLQASGELLGGALSYAAFLGNGLLDGQSSATNTGPGLDVAGRLTLQLHGLGLGVGGSYGPRADSLSDVTYSTSGGTRFLQFAPGAEAVDDQARVAPFLFWLLGPVGLRGEYLRSAQTVRVGTHSARAHNQAWYAEGKVVLTGEKATQVGVTPRGGFAPFQGRLGACLLAARYSELWVDPDLLAAEVVKADQVATLARAASLSLEDYLSPLSKVQVSYEQSWLGGRGLLAGRQERALFTRIQLEW
jgi:phosphate-selective porin OprO/OprP